MISIFLKNMFNSILKHFYTRIFVAVSEKPLNKVNQDTQGSTSAASNDTEINDLWYNIYRGKGM